ncbi:MAG: NAD-dependent epimerase/dehydratase family protein [Bdellovibrionales bacterium]
MKVLVTGANGFLGSWLTRALVEKGHDVTILVRPSSDLSELEGVSYKKAFGDVTDLESLERSFQGQDGVFHLAGVVAYKKKDRAQMEKVNVLGTQNVIAAMEKRNIRKLLHLSSVVAVGASSSPKQILNEDSPYTLSSLDLGYFETKRAAELAVLQAHQQKRIDPIIVNPSTIYGRADAKKGSRSVQLKVAQGRFPFYTSGGVSVVAVEDVIEGILQAWNKGRTGERYILSGENWTIHELFSAIAREAGVPAPRFLLPSFLLHSVGFIGDQMSRLGLKGGLSRENAWTSTMYHWFDNSKARRELGFNPRPANEAIRNSVQWMKDSGLLGK